MRLKSVVQILLLSGAGIVMAADGDAKAEAAANPDIPNIQKVLADLSGADETLKDAAAKALVAGLKEQIEKSPKEYVKKLAADVNGADTANSQAATKSIATMIGNVKRVNDKLLAEIVSKLNSADMKERASVREKFVGLFTTMLEAKQMETLVEDLGSTDPAVSGTASNKLRQAGADAASALVTALEDERAGVKKAAAEILKAMGPAAKDVATDLAFLLDNDDKGTRRLAASVLENLGPNAADAIDDLVQYLDNDEKAVRRLAAGVLKKIGPAVKSATGDLVDLLTNDDKNVRSLAGDVLLSLGKEASEGTEALAEVVADVTNDPDSRERAANILGAIGPDAKDALETLKKHMEDENKLVKEAVLSAIKKIEAAK